ncbi:MAG TPA: glycosyltransferase family 87 protein [Chloroflexia bacterium]|nr:glycosyltransferase family 87 protein [Chloroflexia bacterium]
MSTPSLRSSSHFNKNLAIAGVFLALSFGLLVWVDLAYLMPIKKLDVPNLDNDLSLFWAGSRTIWQGGNPYNYAPNGLFRQIAAEAGGPIDTFVNPLYLTLIFMPLAAFPLKVASLLWLILSQIILGISLTFILKATGEKLSPGVFLRALGLSLLWRYCFEVMILNNISLLMLFAIVASFHWSRTGKPFLAGAVASLLLLKPQIIFLILPLLLVMPTSEDGSKFSSSGWLNQCTYRRWFGFIAAALVLALYSFVIMPDWISRWLQAASERVDPRFNSEMTSVRSLVALVITDDKLIPLVYGAVAVLGSAALIGLWWVNRNNARYFPFLLSTFIAGNLLVAPYTRSYDFSLLLFPLIYLYFTERRLENEKAGQKTGFSWTILWWPLVLFPWGLHLIAVRTTFAWENLIPGLLLVITLLVWRRQAARPVN